MKKIYWTLGFVILILTILAISIHFSNLDSKIKDIVVSKIHQIAKKHNISIQWKAMTVRNFNLKVIFDQFQFKNQILSSEFSSLSLQIAPLKSLLRQQLVFNIQAYNGDIDISHKLSNKKHLPYDFIFPLPVHKVFLKNSKLQVQTSQGPILLTNIDLRLYNILKSLFIDIKTQAQIAHLISDIESQISVFPNKMTIHSFVLKGQDSQLFLTGRAVPSVFNIQTAQFQLKTELTSQDLFTNLRFWKTPFHLPYFSGKAKIQSQFSYSTKEGADISFQAEIQKFLWKHISVDKIKTEGRFIQNRIELKMAHLEKENEWTAFLETTKIHLNKPLSFSSKNYIYIKDFQSIEKIVKKNLGMQFNGPFHSSCQGQWNPMNFQCAITGTANNFQLVLTKKPAITGIPHIRLKGNLLISKNKHLLKGTLSSGSQSRIQFQTSLYKNHNTQFKGFVDFSDVQHIYGLNIEGTSQISQGNLSFSKNQFALKTSLKAKNLLLDGFQLGNLNTHTLISNQGLDFQKIKGKLNKSHYQGSISILFNKKPKIKIQSQFSPLYLEDLSTSFSKKWSLPLSISGTGSAQFMMDSFLKTSRLNYQLTSQFKNIYIQDDFFQKGTLNITSKKGVSQIEKAFMQKIKGHITAHGFLKNFKNLNVQVIGKNLLLERLEFLKSWINSDLTGLFDFQINWTGLLKKPKAVLTSKISQLAYRNTPLKPVQIKMKFLENTVQGEGSFFNDSLIVSNFIWSKEKTSFKLKAHQLNFIPLLPSTIPSSLFSSTVTGTAVLYLPRLKISKASGNFNIQDISLSHGKHKISSTHPISIQFNNGGFSFQRSLLKLKNEDQFLTLKKINSQESLLTGPIHLEFLTLLAPYITSAKGILDMHFSLKNNLNQLSPKGSISIQEGSFKGGPFLETFQNIDLDGELTPQQLNIKKLTAQTSTGNLEGSGSINYSKKHQLPIDLSVRFNQLALNLSKNVKVQGSGIVEFYGDTKPYILKGHFYLNEGWSKGEFENTEKIQMPKINQKQTPWFNINLWVHLKNPFLIENDLILASMEGSLHLLGPYSMPIVSGTLDFLPGGLFHIKDYDFKITSGQAVYEKKPFFNPYLDLTGQTQFEETQYIEDREVNNSYEITAHVYGPVNSIDLKLSSNPPISENNILSMMALGARSVDFGGSAQLSNVTRYSYSQIASALFQGTIGRRLENLLGVELSIIPYISQNKATAKASTKVRARKRWSENLSTSATTSIDEIDRSLRVEYNLTPNFSLLGIWKESKDITVQEEYNFEIEYRVDF